MFAKLFAVVSLAVAAAYAQTGATVQTPAALVECQPVALSVTGGQTPYIITAIPGGQVSAAALVNIATTSSNTYTWTVNIASGTSITIKVVDGQGITSYSAPVTIQAGSSSACLTASSSSASSTSSGATGVASSASSAAATSSSAVSSVASSAVSSATAAASSAASSASTRASSAVSSVSSAASSVANSASSIVSAASSAVASATSTRSGAEPTSVVKAGVALAVGILGGAAALL